MSPIKNKTGRQIIEKAYTKKNMKKVILDINASHKSPYQKAVFKSE